MRNYRLLIAYDGTRYYGWQRQPGQSTVQGKLEGVLNLMCGHETEVIGAGRTDGGAHAEGMTANVRLDTELAPEEIRDYLNRYLPDDIGVLEVREASPRFHARYNATGKTYRYTCFDGEVKTIFDRKYCTRLEEKPDLERMRTAAEALCGEHDFRNFCVNPRMKKSTVRRVDKIEIERDGEYIRFIVQGGGFLQNMVRIMVGTLLEVGYGRMTKEQVQAALENPNRQKAGPTAPAQGLCLVSVSYD